MGPESDCLLSPFPLFRFWVPVLYVCLSQSYALPSLLHNVPPSHSLSCSPFFCQLDLQAFSSITACKPRITAARVFRALHVSADHNFSVQTHTPPTRHLHIHMQDIYIATDTHQPYRPKIHLFNEHTDIHIDYFVNQQYTVTTHWVQIHTSLLCTTLPFYSL